MVIGDTGSVEGIYAFIYCTKWRSGRVSRMPHPQTLKDSATQLLTKYKSGALVTQLNLDPDRGDRGGEGDGGDRIYGADAVDEGDRVHGV